MVRRNKKIVIGTRGSRLALWQAEHVAAQLGRDNTDIKIIKTKGDHIQNVSFDKMEGKGFFTKEIEAALLDGSVDLAVHSLKDLPTEMVPQLRLAAITRRANPFDVLLIRPEAYAEDRMLQVKPGSVIGTSSLRRRAQLKCADSSIVEKALRGNVNTRLSKLREGSYDAIVLAQAGIMRLELDVSDLRKHELPADVVLPAPAQGALGLQIRANDSAALAAAAVLNHSETERAVTAEREFLHHFGGGCQVPLGALALVLGSDIMLTGVVASPDGQKSIKTSVRAGSPEAAGRELARIIKAKGADALL
ncbi:MAG: hydroxymethylbilane synthase [Deltaproteobacteria bacterium]|nr:hydroxymethylbilane synthase [Deltaproteobacteria bacterium]